VLLLLTLIFNFELLAIDKNCSSILNELISTNEKLEGIDLLNSLEKAVVKLQKYESPEDVSKEEISLLKPNGQLLKTLNIIKKEKHSFDFSLWLALEEKIFNHVDMEIAEVVGRTEQAFYQYSKDPLFVSFNLTQSLKSIKKNSPISQKEKKSIILALKKLSQLYSDIYNTKLDFTNPDDLLTFFSVSNKNELRTRLTSLSNTNLLLAKRISSFVKGQNITPARTIRRDLNDFFYNDKNFQLQFNDQVHDYLSRNLTQLRSIDLIEKMKLSVKETQMIKDDIKTVFDEKYNNPISNKVTALLIVYKAFIDNFGYMPNFTNKKVLDRKIDVKQILYIENKLHHKEYVENILEAQLSNYIDTTDRIDARIKELSDSISNFKKHYGTNEVESAEMLDTIEGFRIQEFDQDLDTIEKKLSMISFNLDELIENALKTVRNENILHFHELNLRWRRLLPGKKYKIKGSDYSYVTFSKNITSYFTHDEKKGSRFLAVLAKSYVPVKASSGLRRIPDLHKDFRDIKLISSGGKIRLVGRIVNDTIHFFHIHDTTDAYRSSDIKKIIENFSID
jgi:uncharacterized protein (UPF0335 family)